MPVRKDILTDSATRDAYIRGVKLLKAEMLPGQSMRTYDRYVLWHVRAMSTRTPTTHPTRNAAHAGPVFLPWHRMFLNRLETDLQRVLNDASFALPYWNWATDALLADPLASALWANDALGSHASNGSVTQGPFRRAEWPVRVGFGPTGSIVTNLNRALGRNRATNGTQLPTATQIKTVLQLGTYDTADWDRASPNSFRNQLEGWNGPNLHNRVHMWVGGDMTQMFSPNDPVFFLHHANVDRIWTYWQTLHPNAYEPRSGSITLQGHRFNDAMFPLGDTDPAIRPRDVMGLPSGISYDTFADLQ